jgi:hypothetical protein
MKDYSKIKALAQEILECIGDEPEGENPDLPKTKEEDKGGDDGIVDGFSPKQKTGKDEGEDKKKKKDSGLALLAANLSKKFSKD